MNRPDFAAMDAFAKVAGTGSFRAAALALSAPVSTVSVQVSRLEEQLGTKLLQRTTRKVSLTDEGRRFFEQIRTALDLMNEAERSISGAAGTRGRLRIAAPVELGQAVLGKVIGRYAQDYPDVALEVVLTGDRLEPPRDGFDVVLQTDPSESSALVARKLGSPMKYRLTASAAYLARRGRPKHPRELAEHDCLVMGTRSTPSTWRFLRGRTSHTVVHRHATANSWQLVRDLSVAGCGIARLPDYLGAPSIAEGVLEPVLDAFAPPAEQIYAVYPKSRYLPERIAGFVAALEGYLAVWPGCLARRR